MSILEINKNQAIDLIKQSDNNAVVEFVISLLSNAPDIIPEWQQSETAKRLEEYKRNPKSVIDFDDMMNRLSKKYGV